MPDRSQYSELPALTAEQIAAAVAICEQAAGVDAAEDETWVDVLERAMNAAGWSLAHTWDRASESYADVWTHPEIQAHNDSLPANDVFNWYFCTLLAPKHADIFAPGILLFIGGRMGNTVHYIVYPAACEELVDNYWEKRE